MIRKALAKLRTLGIDIQSNHRRRATNPLTVVQRVLRGRDVRTVLDCGAHHGNFALEFQRMFPAANVYSFEPTPATYQVIRKRLAGVPRIEVINAAVGEKSGTLDFFIADDEQSNSLVRPSADAKTVQVEVVSLGDFCKERKIGHIDVLKMDVEGFELATAKGLEQMLRAQEVDVILTEVRFQPPSPGATHFVELVGYLQGLGYQFYGFYSTLYKPTLQYDWGDIIMVSSKAIARQS